MHIPKGPTAGLELALFEPALQAALQPSPDYDAARWLYVPNTYSEYRYILGTRGKKPLICVASTIHRGPGCPGPYLAERPAHCPG